MTSSAPYTGAVFKRLFVYLTLKPVFLWYTMSSSSVSDVPGLDKLLSSSGKSPYAERDFPAKKFSSRQPCLPFCDLVAMSAHLSAVLSSAVVQRVLQEPSETVNVRSRGDSCDMSAGFKLVLDVGSLHRLRTNTNR